ncbi:MAG: thioredoxin family protein [Flavobacteriales bacterium]|nr:thioredoxin family protein [Flavobacteriales bacterium]
MTRTTPLKSIVSVLIIALAFVMLKSDTKEVGINFSHLGFAQAKAEAQKQNKLIFIDAYTTWCGPCKQMAATVFKEKSVGDVYNKNFINLKMDMETSEGLFVGKKYNVTAYPTFLYLKPDGTLVGKQMGATSSANFIQYAKTAAAKK